jgi:hypothetical protein
MYYQVNYSTTVISVQYTLTYTLVRQEYIDELIKTMYGFFGKGEP